MFGPKQLLIKATDNLDLTRKKTNKRSCWTYTRIAERQLRANSVLKIWTIMQTEDKTLWWNESNWCYAIKLFAAKPLTNWGAKGAKSRVASTEGRRIEAQKRPTRRGMRRVSPSQPTRRSVATSWAPPAGSGLGQSRGLGAIAPCPG